MCDIHGIRCDESWATTQMMIFLNLSLGMQPPVSLLQLDLDS